MEIMQLKFSSVAAVVSLQFPVLLASSCFYFGAKDINNNNLYSHYSGTKEKGETKTKYRKQNDRHFVTIRSN